MKEVFYNLEFDKEQMSNILLALDNARSQFLHSIQEAQDKPEFSGMVEAWKHQVEQYTTLAQRFSDELDKNKVVEESEPTLAHWYDPSNFMPDYDRVIIMAVRTSDGIDEVRGLRNRDTGHFKSCEPITPKGTNIFGVVKWRYL